MDIPVAKVWFRTIGGSKINRLPPGLEGANAVGVGMRVAAEQAGLGGTALRFDDGGVGVPRVGLAGQPWAGGRNAVGVGMRVTAEQAGLGGTALRFDDVGVGFLPG
jgi:hypothetical protein